MLVKAEDEKWGMTLLEGSIKPLVSLIAQKPKDGQFPPQEHSRLVAGPDLESSQTFLTREPLLAVGRFLKVGGDNFAFVGPRTGAVMILLGFLKRSITQTK